LVIRVGFERCKHLGFECIGSFKVRQRPSVTLDALNNLPRRVAQIRLAQVTQLVQNTIEHLPDMLAIVPDDRKPDNRKISSILTGDLGHTDLMLAMETVFDGPQDTPFVLERLGVVDEQLELEYSNDHGSCLHFSRRSPGSPGIHTRSPSRYANLKTASA
jgi:hypothetical protein